MRDRARGPTSRVLVGFVAALLLLALGACDGRLRSGERPLVRVGVPPVSDAAPLFIGIEKGFFEDENLTVERRLLPAGAGIVEAVVSGDVDFGIENTTSLVIARSKGLPLRIVSYGALGGSNYEEGGSSHILVRRDGPIRTVEDLEGKTVTVPALRVVGHLAVNAALDKNGVDHTKVRFVEVPFPAAVGALDAGRVDAILVAEPFATLGLRAGHRSIIRPVIETAPDFITVAYFTTQELLERQPDVADRFIRALTRSLRYAARHPEEIRRVVPTYTKIPAPVAQKMGLSDFSRPNDYSTLQLNIDLAKKYGFIDRKPKLSELLYEP